jgi:hypothetical protein
MSKSCTQVPSGSVRSQAPSIALPSSVKRPVKRWAKSSSSRASSRTPFSSEIS